MTQRYRLHYAPDNASLAIRLALETLGLAYDTALIDRRNGALNSPAYRALNPGGLIPVLETAHGPIFETAAILLWLADRHGGLGPAPADPARGTFLKWLFFTSNTLHADLRMVFYPAKYIGPDPQDQAALRRGLTARLQQHLTMLDRAVAAPDWPGGATELYLCCLLRWMPLYPDDQDNGWFDLSRYPALAALATRIEATPAAAAASAAEGLGPTPFTAPRPATPPEGSPT
ncbi:glutathione S-transferase family protein [Pseudodonghicola flavimaris]|uniref:Glutathione S-transferase family protein n=1 Tax=Pseudodonghicola flavimaris TaxID=3050036 RepID=A0ABT7EUT4_9RHOB|nr:glutathione S-transferase family protein [Pseudodonghicola flavimaris]MDK3016104.1 glutathione S-transferase family protein [Pseudodonghicola flavimaris]